MDTIKRTVRVFVIVVILALFVFILKTGEVSSQPSDGNNSNISNITRQSLEGIIKSEIDVPFVDPRILEKFESNVSEVRVMVNIRDASEISISARDSKEQQNIKDVMRKTFLENKTNMVLSKLSETEFKLRRRLLTGRGFSGNITREGLWKLANDSNVETIRLEGISHILLDESASLINADDVEGLGYTGKYQTVCIIDTGIDYNNSDLGGCLGSGCKVRSGWNYVVPEGHADEDDPMDDHGHGTHVAGIVASEDSTYRGIAPDADLVALKACNSEGDCYDGPVQDSLSFCYVSRNLYNISVVSISIGDNGEHDDNCTNPSYAYANNEINDLHAVGIPVIVASGNDWYRNGISYPACAPNVTSIGATDKNDNIASYTNRDTSPLSPDLFAPGGVWGNPGDTPPVSEIVSLYSQNVATDSNLCFLRGFPWIGGSACNDHLANLSGNKFIRSAGTSMAAPHVSGAAALLLELNGSLTPNTIETIFKNTGVPVGDYKRIDVLAAINSIRDNDSDTYISKTYGGNDCNDSNANVHPGAGEVCDEIDNDCDDSIDEGCVNDCTESGYEQCFQSSYADCTTGIAINRYENVNTIRWGTVNDSSDPYVINEYKIGWKTRGGKKAYYGNLVNETCQYGGCDVNKQVALQDAKVTVTAPGTANHKETLSYNDTASNACWTWFYNFNPNYGSTNLIYVLKCFQDSDCSSGYFCNKAGSWSAWDCVAKYANGQSCTSDYVCQSNYCDNDGVGLADDNWCFSPYNTYFDGQENSYCEYSADEGVADCDERQVGADLNKCINLSYYEEECSSTCNYQDITSVFECTESGCSCAEPLCDGGTTGTAITTCAVNNTYFADKCTSAASGEDRGDNICRSSAFASDCTANSQCNGVTAGTSIGTGSCSLTCLYDAFPNVTLVSPPDGNISSTGNVVFNCSATDDYNLTNMTLYHNLTGLWKANETKVLTGTSDSKTFTINNINDGVTFVWNCLAYDNASQIDWANVNYSVTVNTPLPNVTVSSLSVINSSGAQKIFEAVILNNGDIQLRNVTWKLDFGDGNVINSVQNTSLAVDEDVFVYAEHIYGFGGSFEVIANASGTAAGKVFTDGLLINVSVNGTGIFPDVNKFYVKNSSGDNIAWFGDAGNIVIKGFLEQNSTHLRGDNFAFVIRNDGKDVLIIEGNGSMYINGTLFENQDAVTTKWEDNDFRVKGEGTLVIDVNETGYVFLKGELTENANSSQLI